MFEIASAMTKKPRFAVSFACTFVLSMGLRFLLDGVSVDRLGSDVMFSLVLSIGAAVGITIAFAARASK